MILFSFYHVVLLRLNTILVSSGDIALPARPIHHHSNSVHDDVKHDAKLKSPDEPSDVQSKQILRNICNPTINPFLTCSGDFKFGAFGTGMMVTIINNPDYGVSVYRNCVGKTENPTEGSFTQSCFVSPISEPKIIGFIKVPKAEAERANRYTFLSTLSAFDKEVRRTREFAREQTADGQPLGPAIIDICIISTSLPHPLHQEAFIQEWITGLDVYTLFVGLQRNEAIMIRDNLDDVLCRLGNYTKIMTTQDNSEVKDSVVRLQKELWMRARLRIRLGWSVMVAAGYLWNKGIVHCDIHWGNIMSIRSHAHSMEELLELIQGGLVYMPHDSFRHSTTEAASTIRRPLSSIEVYRIHPTQIRFIDVAYALKLHSILDEISKNRNENSELTASQQLQHPCTTYRSERNEDLLELFNGGGGGLAALFSTKSSFRNHWKETLELFRNQSSVSCRQVLLQQNDRIVVNALHSLERETFEIDRLYQNILSLMENTDEYKSCVNDRKIWSALPRKDRFDVIKSARPYERTEQIIPQQSCSFHAIQQGGLKFRQIIEQAALQFPNFTNLNLTLP